MRRVARHVVSDLIFDEHNEREMARHGVVRHQVEQLKANRKVFSDVATGDSVRREPSSPRAV